MVWFKVFRIMERYHSYGGKSNPEFRYRVSVENVTDEMMNWCSVYPANSSFERYYIEWDHNQDGDYKNTVFQFETERPAILFKLKFGDQ
jgi:hypothetical protein